MSGDPAVGILLTSCLVAAVLALRANAREAERQACLEWIRRRTWELAGPPRSMRNPPPSEGEKRAFDEVARLAFEIDAGAHRRRDRA